MEGENLKPGQCLICIKPEAEYIANKVVKRELTNEQAAKELDVKPSEWISHYELHVRKKLLTAISNDMEPIKKLYLDKVKEGTDSLDRLIKLTKSISTRLENEDSQKNLRLIQTYAILEKNVINGLKELAILEGEIHNATNVYHQTNIIKVDKIMSIVMEEATPELKKRILGKLEAIAPSAN